MVLKTMLNKTLAINQYETINPAKEYSLDSASIVTYVGFIKNPISQFC